MESGGERNATEERLAFVGSILAGFTHELKNHLAIIKESAGLLQDMIELGKSGLKKEGERLLPPIGSIHEQIERSVRLINHLNRFSHRMDAPGCDYRIADAMEELMELLARTARQKKIALDRDFAERLPRLFGSPALVQYAVYCLLMDAFERVESGGAVRVGVAAADGGVAITVSWRGAATGGESGARRCEQETVRDLIRQTGGTIAEDDAGGSVRLILPLRAA